MMIGYGSGMMPIVGRSGPVITAVPVHWFLPKNVFSNFSHSRSQLKLDLYQTWYDDWLWVGNDAYCRTSRSGGHSRSGPLVSTQKWCFHMDMFINYVMKMHFLTVFTRMLIALYHGVLKHYNFVHG